MVRITLALMLVMATDWATPSPSFAQTPGIGATPPNPVPRPAFDGTETVVPLTQESNIDGTPPGQVQTVAPSASPTPGFDLVPPDLNAQPVPVRFSASLTAESQPLNRDVVWSIYAMNEQGVGQDDLVLNAQSGILEASLPPGSYVVHLSYGLATLSRPLTIGSGGIEEDFALGAGGMSLRGAIGAEDYLPSELVNFLVYRDSADDDEDAAPLVSDVDERTVLVVPAGRYTVVSQYGDVNATVRAQIDVEAGQLTEAVMFHRAAQITLKLVNEPNGEALPNTAWSVLNEGGDVLREFIGAFPTMVLSEADYTIIARHDGQVFTRNFSVVAGINREVELVAQ